MLFSTSFISSLVLASSLALAQPIELNKREAIKPTCQKKEMCQPAAGSTLDNSFDFRYHGVSSGSAASKYLSLELHPVPASKSRINASQPPKNATMTSPSDFHWKEDGSTYMFEGKAGIPCGTNGEYNIWVHDHVEVNGRNVTELHKFGPYQVTTESCEEAIQPEP